MPSWDTLQWKIILYHCSNRLTYLVSCPGSFFPGILADHKSLQHWSFTSQMTILTAGVLNESLIISPASANLLFHQQLSLDQRRKTTSLCTMITFYMKRWDAHYSRSNESLQKEEKISQQRIHNKVSWQLRHLCIL